MTSLNSLAAMLAMAALSMMVGGCASMPNPVLEEARQSYTEAQADPEVTKYAPVALQEAAEAVQVAEKMAQSKGADDPDVGTLAYVAKQRVAIAREQAKLNAAEQAIARAREERKDLLLNVRDQEAQAAEARARELADKLKALEAERTERGLVLTLGDVLFAVNKAELQPGGYEVVNRLAQFLKSYPSRHVLIEGFTDSSGSDAYNQELSERRARAVRDALIEQGVTASRISTIGYGERYPVASNDTASGRQRNRRVEVVISDEKGVIPPRRRGG